MKARRHWSPVLAAIILTVVVMNALHGHRDGSLAEGSARSQLLEVMDVSSVTSDLGAVPRWQLPPEWRSKIVAAVPMSEGGLNWVRASRSWRRGMRTAFVLDSQPPEDVVHEGRLHGESFVFLNTSAIPYAHFGKAAMVPSVASEHFGEGTYDWLLYGDDDTVWFMDTVLDIISGLDPNLPWMISDHFWFWRQEVNPTALHPAPDAPRCVPCGYNKTGLDLKALGFDPPLACPYCTVDKLCKADGRRDLYHEGNCTLRLRYPPWQSKPETEGEYLAHGGAGIILSAGLMRMLPTSYMTDCILSKFSPERVRGGDTLFSHCVFHQGIAPTDPGHFFKDTSYSSFDPGGQNVRNILDLYYQSMKKGCCDATCRDRLKRTATVHLRGFHFNEPEAAMAYMEVFVRLRDTFLYLQDKAVRSGGHPDLAPSWDNHKVCA